MTISAIIKIAPVSTPFYLGCKNRNTSLCRFCPDDNFLLFDVTKLSIVSLFLQKDLALKPPERKEKWERHPSKKSRASGKYISAEPSENGHNHDAGSSERELERGKERDKKKYPLKAVNQVRSQTVPFMLFADHL